MDLIHISCQIFSLRFVIVKSLIKRINMWVDTRELCKEVISGKTHSNGRGDLGIQVSPNRMTMILPDDTKILLLLNGLQNSIKQWRLVTRLVAR